MEPITYSFIAIMNVIDLGIMPSCVGEPHGSPETRFASAANLGPVAWAGKSRAREEGARFATSFKRARAFKREMRVRQFAAGQIGAALIACRSQITILGDYDMAGTFRFPGAETEAPASAPAPQYHHYAVMREGKKVSSISASPALSIETVLSFWMTGHDVPRHLHPIYSLVRYA